MSTQEVEIIDETLFSSNETTEALFVDLVSGP